MDIGCFLYSKLELRKLFIRQENRHLYTYVRIKSKQHLKIERKIEQIYLVSYVNFIILQNANIYL